MLFSGKVEEKTGESRVPVVFVLAVTEAERRRRQGREKVEVSWKAVA